MPAYDQVLFDPPAPVAAVTVRHPSSGVVVGDVRMLIDSGADATLLPERVAQQLGLSADEGGMYELVGFNDSKSLSPAVRAELIFSGKTFRGQFLLTPNHWGILGRNVLNHISLVLDGPKLQWEMMQVPGIR